MANKYSNTSTGDMATNKYGKHSYSHSYSAGVAFAPGPSSWSLVKMSLLSLLALAPVDASYVSYEHVPAYAQGQRYVSVQEL
jgi:hypothetical protein